MFVDYVIGVFIVYGDESSSDLDVVKICCVIIVGGMMDLKMSLEEFLVVMSEVFKEFDIMFVEFASAVFVDVMSGKTDSTNKVML